MNAGDKFGQTLFLLRKASLNPIKLLIPFQSPGSLGDRQTFPLGIDMTPVREIDKLKDKLSARNLPNIKL